MSRPIVSVVIPTYNCEQWVSQAVESALAQTLAPIEIIVVDDGSTDDTAAVLADVRSQIQYIYQPNRGVAAARNTGFQASTGEFLAILDADDVWHPRKLALQVQAMREHPSIGTLGTRVFDWPNQSIPCIKVESAPRVSIIDRDALAVKNYLAASSVMVRRDVMDAVGGFDTQLQGAADHDYWLRAAEFAAVANIELPLMGYRSLAGSMSKQARAMEADMRRILTKLDARDYWRGDRLLRRKAYSYVSYSCAYLHGAAGNQVGAIKRSLASLAWYPLPFTRTEAGVWLGRPKRLTVQVLRLAGAMQPDFDSGPDPRTASGRARVSPDFSTSDANPVAGTPRRMGGAAGGTMNNAIPSIENCPSCGSSAARPIHHREFQGRVWTLARCPACTLEFTSPTPTQQDLEAFYAGDYHADLRREGGAEAAFGAKYRRYAEALERHLVSGRVVDVGCSTGLLVRMLTDRGFVAEGVELNPQSAAWGSAHYNIPIHTKSLENSPFAKGSLDAVLLTDVLEHTRHPREFLKGVGELLAPGGFVLVTFPDIASVESRYRRVLAAATRREWLWNTCHIPLHVWEFTRETAEACFAGAGFRVVEFRRTQGPIENDTSGMLNALTWPLRALRWSPLACQFGTQMEFVIQKVREPVRAASMTADAERREAA